MIGRTSRQTSPAFCTSSVSAEYRDVEIAGTLHRNLRATTVLTVKASAQFQGEIHGGHLIIEEGGGLNAVLNVVNL